MILKMKEGRTSAGENFQTSCPQYPDIKYNNIQSNSHSVTPKLAILVINTPVLYSFQFAKKNAVYVEKYSKKICRFYNWAASPILIKMNDTPKASHP